LYSNPRSTLIVPVIAALNGALLSGRVNVGMSTVVESIGGPTSAVLLKRASASPCGVGIVICPRFNRKCGVILTC
jgi:hypothetical protein